MVTCTRVQYSTCPFTAQWRALAEYDACHISIRKHTCTYRYITCICCTMSSQPYPDIPALNTISGHTCIPFLNLYLGWHIASPPLIHRQPVYWLCEHHEMSTLQFWLLSRRMFLAARSLWMKPFPARYFMPSAIWPQNFNSKDGVLSLTTLAWLQGDVLRIHRDNHTHR